MRTLLAGTREWWVTAKRLAAACTVWQPRHSRTTGLPRTMPPASVGERFADGPPARRHTDATGRAQGRLHLVTPDASRDRWRSGGRGAARRLLSGARRRMLVTVPYARPAAASVKTLLDLMTRASSRGVACGLLLGATSPNVGMPSCWRRCRLQVRRMDPVQSTSGHAKGARGRRLGARVLGELERRRPRRATGRPRCISTTRRLPPTTPRRGGATGRPASRSTFDARKARLCSFGCPMSSRRRQPALLRRLSHLLR